MDKGSAIGTIGNVVLLPVAYHSHPDERIVRVVGPPQMVIPVAVSHVTGTCATRRRPLRQLVVDAALAPSIEFPKELEIRIGDSNSQEERIFLPLAAVPQCSGSEPIGSSSSVIQSLPRERGKSTTLPNKANIFDGHSKFENFRTNTPIGDPTPESGNEEEGQKEPLDLSLNGRLNGRRDSNVSDDLPVEEAPSSSSSNAGLRNREKVHANQNVSPPARKRLACDCGVSFLAEETLRGHQSYYCRNRVPNDSLLKFPLFSLGVRRKSMSECLVCKLQCSSQLQLNHHTRTVHGCGDASLTCILCNYKACSPRGAKIHLRVAHGIDQSNDNDLERLHGARLAASAMLKERSKAACSS